MEGLMGVAIIVEYLNEMTEEQVVLFSRSMADSVALGTPLTIDPDRVDLVVSGDFVQSIRDRMDDPMEATAYTTQRGAGTVAAKTMPNKSDGRVAIVMPAGFMLLDDEGAVDLRRRTLVHEFAHVAIYQAGEASNGCRQRLAGGTVAQADLVALAGIAVEEFRAELSVYEAGWQAEDQNIEDDVASAQDAFRSAAEMVRASDYGGALGTAFNALNILCQRLAYVAASLVHRCGREGLDEILGDSPSQVFLRALIQAPSGSKRTQRDHLDGVINAVAGSVRELLLEVGFDYRDTADQGPWFGFADAYPRD